MNLVVTSYQRLAALYGPVGQAQVAAALARLIDARAGRGIASLLYAPEDGVSSLGVAPARLEPPDLAAQLERIARALQARGAPVASLLIVGGPRVIPFERVTNPLPDRDGLLPVDCAYGLLDAESYLTNWPVGRLPDAAEPTPRMLVGLLDAAAILHRRVAMAASSRTFGYSAATWLPTARSIYAEIGDPVELLVSPPTLAATLERRRMEGVQIVYCNLHGVREGPFWYGQLGGTPELLVALRPSDLDGLDLNGALVVSQACYGAAIENATAATSLALAFLARGAAAFVGATAMAYGALHPPASDSDLIALHLFRAIRAPGASVGTAFQAARAGALRDTLRMQGFLDEDDVKTLLTFVLYGDPTISCW